MLRLTRAQGIRSNGEHGSIGRLDPSDGPNRDSNRRPWLMFVLGLTLLTSVLCGACESVFCVSLSAGDSKLVIPPPVERNPDDWIADGEKSGSLLFLS